GHALAGQELIRLSVITNAQIDPARIDRGGIPTDLRPGRAGEAESVEAPRLRGVRRNSQNALISDGEHGPLYPERGPALRGAVVDEGDVVFARHRHARLAGGDLAHWEIGDLR